MKPDFPRSNEAAMVVHTIVSVVLLFVIERELRELRIPDRKQRGSQISVLEVLVYRCTR